MRIWSKHKANTNREAAHTNADAQMQHHYLSSQMCMLARRRLHAAQVAQVQMVSPAKALADNAAPL